MKIPATKNNEKTSAGAISNRAGSTPFFQPKLTINEPGDKYEQEADQVADQVMRMEEGDAPIVQRMPLTPVSGLQRKCAECEKEEKEQVQRKETGGQASGKTAPSVVSNILSSGGGQPMDGGTRQFMESRFGQDFGQVRIHTTGQAAESAAAIQARAYTSGRDIVFGEGEYQPGSEGGKRLLAHELVHVGQQNNAVPENNIIQRDLRKNYHDNWGAALETLNNEYIAVGGVIDRQISAVQDFTRYANIPDPPSLTDQIIQSGASLILGAVIPGVGNVIKAIASSWVREQVRGSVNSIIDSMIGFGRSEAQSAVRKAWSQSSSQTTQLLKFEITMRQALQDIGQKQVALMNQELSALIVTTGEEDEWAAADALHNGFTQSLSHIYDEQFNKTTDLWFTMQITYKGLDPGVLQISLARRFPHQGEFQIEGGNLIGSGDVHEIRARLARRPLKDINIPKIIRMNGKMGYGIADCPWYIRVTGELPQPQDDGTAISAPRAPRPSFERLMEGSQRVTEYGGHPYYGLPWLAAFHLGLDDLKYRDSRNSEDNRSAGSSYVWERVKNMQIGQINNSSW